MIRVNPQLALESSFFISSSGCLALIPDQDKCGGIYNVLFQMQNCTGDPQIPEKVCLVIVFNWHNWLDSLGDYLAKGHRRPSGSICLDFFRSQNSLHTTNPKMKCSCLKENQEELIPNCLQDPQCLPALPLF